MTYLIKKLTRESDFKLNQTKMFIKYSVFEIILFMAALYSIWLTLFWLVSEFNICGCCSLLSNNLCSLHKVVQHKKMY